MPPVPPSRPPIPLQMAGGRAQPGNTLRRTGTPAPVSPSPVAAASASVDAAEAGNASTLAAPPSFVAPGGGGAPLAGYYFSFAPASAGSAAPAGGVGGGGLGSAFSTRGFARSRPVVGGSGGGGSGRSAFAAAARRRSRALHVATGCVVAGGGGSGIWGRAVVAGSQGQFGWETSDRMDEWLERLRVLSLTGDNKAGRAAIEAGNFVQESSPTESKSSARTGDKRSAPSDHDADDETSEPASKRSRVGNVFNRAIARIGGRGRTTNLAKTETTTATTATSAPASSAGALGATSTAPTSPLFSRAPSPFNALSRAGSALGMGTGASRSQDAHRRKLNICLVGDVAAGKSAFFNRLASNSFTSTSPSMAPDFKSLNTRMEDGSLVNVELWDFPGIAAGQRAGPLLSTFFHAAIICFSLEDQDNLNAISEVWKPKLDACLHDQDTFVLGLKSDLRPDYPTLSLSFLPPTKEPATFWMGEAAAVAIKANCYGECSAKSNAHVQFVWENFLAYTIERLDKYEKTIGNGCRRAKAKAAVARVFKRLEPFGKGKKPE